MTTLRKVITVPSMTVNNCASPNKVPVPTHKAAPQKRLVPSGCASEEASPESVEAASFASEEQEQSDIRFPSFLPASM